jgi:hypothetical protein
LKFLKKKKNLIRYIGENSFLDYQERVAILNLNIKMDTANKAQESLRHLIKMLLQFDLLTYVFETESLEILKVKPLYILSDNRLIEIKEIKFKDKEKRHYWNLKKKKNKHSMQLIRQRKVRSKVKVVVNCRKIVSILFLYTFFKDKSWPATQGRVKTIQNDVRELIESYLIKWYDMAAVEKLNTSMVTGVQTNIMKFCFLNQKIACSILKLIVLLHKMLQLLSCGTSMQLFIEALIILFNFCRVYILYVSSWPATQGIFSNSIPIFLSSPIRSRIITPQHGGTYPECIPELMDTISHSYKGSTSMIQFREGRDPDATPAETLGELLLYLRVGALT